MLYETDVFVVGGGPAGLAAGIAARNLGFRVIVADGAAPPITKACGEGLLPDSLVALQDLGVEFRKSEGYPLHGIRGIRMPMTMLPDVPRRWLRNVNHKRPVVAKDGLDRPRILPKSPLVEAVRFESQGRPESWPNANE